MKKTRKNLCFIDGQNLHMGARSLGWDIDYKKLKDTLSTKFNVDEAYYFIGTFDSEHQELYEGLQKDGYIVSFRNHAGSLKSAKKGNVDADVVFRMMRALFERPDEFDKMILISSDGDYRNVIDYLIEKDRLQTMIFPTKRGTSSLYDEIDEKYHLYLDSLEKDVAQ